MYANRVLGSIPYGTLIGSPMTAAVEAQALAAQTSVDFIRTVGFTADLTDDEAFGDVRQVTFSYSFRDTETDALTTASLNVPVLTIVPIPYLRIEEMTIDFTSKITEEMVRTLKRDTTTKADTSLAVNYKSFFSPVKVGFKASLSRESKTSSARSNRYKTEHTININVKAVQDDIPGGMGRVLDILETAIQSQAPAATA